MESQKAKNLDEIICAVGVKKANYIFLALAWQHTLRRAPMWWHGTKNHQNIRDHFTDPI